MSKETTFLNKIFHGCHFVFKMAAMRFLNLQILYVTNTPSDSFQTHIIPAKNPIGFQWDHKNNMAVTGHFVKCDIGIAKLNSWKLTLANASIILSAWILSHMRYCVKRIQIFCIYSYKSGVFRGSWLLENSSLLQFMFLS